MFVHVRKCSLSVLKRTVVEFIVGPHKARDTGVANDKQFHHPDKGQNKRKV